jgi:predicted SAM-dependent methyltransferase
VTAHIIELGAGANPNPLASIHHDRILHDDIDVAHDLTQFPWPWDDNEFEGIVAIDVFEHLPNVTVQQWLDECHRILMPRGFLMMRLPAFNNQLSYRDPTHYRVFHPDTFGYWDPDNELHTNFGRYYFAESDRWWKVRAVFTEEGDFRYDLEKR